jgi:hypothetical protein
MPTCTDHISRAKEPVNPWGRVADVHFGLATLQDLGGVTAGTKPRNETHSVLHLKQAAA